MKAFVDGLRDLWRDIEENPPHAPPGCNKGGGVAFIIWFGGFGLIIALGMLGVIL